MRACAPGNIVLILDGQRQCLYRGPLKKDACFESLRSYVLKRVGLMGYEVIDMHPVFERVKPMDSGLNSLMTLTGTRARTD